MGAYLSVGQDFLFLGKVKGVCQEQGKVVECTVDTHRVMT